MTILQSPFWRILTLPRYDYTFPSPSSPAHPLTSPPLTLIEQEAQIILDSKAPEFWYEGDMDSPPHLPHLPHLPTPLTFSTP